MTVYAPNKGDKVLDLSVAERWGKVEFVNDRYVYGDELGPQNQFPVHPATLIETVSQQFNPEQDYLLICGDHLQLVALTAAISRRNVWFNVLRWDRNERAYIPVRIGYLTLARSPC